MIISAWHPVLFGLKAFSLKGQAQPEWTYRLVHDLSIPMDTLFL